MGYEIYDGFASLDIWFGKWLDQKAWCNWLLDMAWHVLGLSFEICSRAVFILVTTLCIQLDATY